jgi:replication factor C subunit 2/4
MRQAINNLQSTFSGFGFVSAENVFKVCDQPHPILVQDLIRACSHGEIDESLSKLYGLWDQGYSAVDIVTTIFRVVKTFDEWVYSSNTDYEYSEVIRLPEYSKLEFIKEIGFTHMRILEGVGTLAQLTGLLSRLCRMVCLAS